MADRPETPDGDAMGPRNADLTLAVWLFGIASVGAALLAGCRLMENHVKDHTPGGCAECHVDISRQWAASAHAEAWNDPYFRRVSADRTVDDCLPCHAPEPLHHQPPGEEPRLRQQRRSDGVGCRACHAVGCKYAGPHESWGPHGMVQDRTRLPCSSFCGTCHNYEQKEWAALYAAIIPPGKQPKQCIGCHMPACTDRLTQDHLLSLAHPKRTVHDHSFPAFNEALIRQAIRLDGLGVLQIGENEMQVEFTLINLGAGHRIPTGKYGYRELRIRAELLDAEGKRIGYEEESLNGARRDGLVPGQPTLFSLTVFTDAGSTPASVRVLVNRINLDRSVRANLVTHEEPLP